MLILKRVTVWLLEMFSEAILLSVLLTVSSIREGPRPFQWSFVKELLFAVSAITYVFMWHSGYLLTTAVLRIVWKRPRLWLYSVVAVVVFLIHLQVIFLIASGWTASERLPVQVGGACIVYGCTFVGSWFLRKWVQASSKQLDLQRRGVPRGVGG
jgi:hypothetical protein